MELIEAIAERFGVDCSSCDLSKYFYAEANFDLPREIQILLGRKQRPGPLTIEMLLRSVRLGRWID